MSLRRTHHTKIIAAALAFFITALGCAAFDVSVDTFSSGGSITGKSTVCISHSLISFVHTGIALRLATAVLFGASVVYAAVIKKLPAKEFLKAATRIRFLMAVFFM